MAASIQLSNLSPGYHITKKNRMKRLIEENKRLKFRLERLTKENSNLKEYLSMLKKSIGEISVESSLSMEFNKLSRETKIRMLLDMLLIRSSEPSDEMSVDKRIQMLLEAAKPSEFDDELSKFLEKLRNSL